MGETRVKLQSLELGRFIAASLVMLSHVLPYVNGHAAPGTAPIWGNMLIPGPLGVQYFFVLSGFVMASVHYRDFGKLASVPRFWWRRACRIYPAYWLALLIPIFYLYGSMTPGLTVHMLFLDPWFGQEYIPATWSMRVEMAFYIMFGLCLLPYVGKPILALWVAVTAWHCFWVQGFWVLSAVVRPGTIMPVYKFFDQDMMRFVVFMEFYFFTGLAAGFTFVRFRWSRKIWAGLLAAGVLGLSYTLPREAWGVTYGPSPYSALIMACVLALALLGLAGLERAGGFRLGRWAGWLGAISFPIYIFHEPLMLLITNELHPGQHHRLGLYAMFVAITAGTLAVATAVAFLFDQPVQRALRRVGKKKERPEQSPGLPAYSASRR